MGCTTIGFLQTGEAAHPTRVIGQSIAFMNCLRTANAITEPRTQALFEQCKNLIGIHFPVGLVETTEVTSPALHGFFRPVLLLPTWDWRI